MRLARLAALTTLFAPAAVAQTIYFEDTFDVGLENWTATAEGANPSAWHWMASADPCAPALPTPGGAARMGDSDCTFNSVGADIHTLTLLTPVYIPLQADAPQLNFSSRAGTEGCFHWDFHYAEISSTSNPAWTGVAWPCNQGSWHTYTLDLSSYRGESIRVRFRFDPVDASSNDGLGWLIDDVRISAAQCSAENYCVASPNSGSVTGARMAYSGSGRIHLNSFVLEAHDGPPNEFLLFVCGPERIQMPLGDGTLCVGPGSVGLMRLGPIARFDPTGSTSYAFDFTSPQVSQGEFLPGSNWQFQCWFRDGGGPAGSNLSDALSVTFCP